MGGGGVTFTPWMSVQETCEYLSIGRDKFYRLLDHGLPAHRLGRRLVCHRDEIDAWVKEEAA